MMTGTFVLLCALGQGVVGAGMPVRLGQTRLPGTPLSARPAALSVLANETSQRTSIIVDPHPMLVPLRAPDIFSVPLLFLPAEGELKLPGQDELAAFGIWLQRGGTLVVDYGGDPAGAETFLDSVARLSEAVLPGSRLDRIPAGHVLYRTYYRIRTPTGRVQVFPDMYGVALGGRLAIIVSLNDLLGGLDRTRGGEWRFRAVPGGDRQRERAIRLGVNLVTYALCLGYKNEKVHLDYLRSRRNWRLKPSQRQEGN